MLTISIRAGEKFYCATVSAGWAKRHDNGALISCGLSVGEDGLRRTSLDYLIRRGLAVEVSRETWAHSGCQSACVLRGAPACRW